MFRSLTLLSFAAVIAVSLIAFSIAIPQNVVAQNAVAQGKSQDVSEPVIIKATPEILALFDETFQSLAPAEPRQRIEGYFGLLNFCTLFEDKTPAKKVIENILALAPALESDELRHQLYEGVAQAFCDIGEYPDAAEVLNRIAKPDDRYEFQINLAHRFVESNEWDKISKTFDISALLRQAAADAATAKHYEAEAYALSILGHVLARQEKPGESVIAFAKAIEIAKKVESVPRQGNILKLILINQAKSGQVADALTTLQAITHTDVKQDAVVSLISEFFYLEKYDEAANLIKTLPSGQTKDMLIFDCVMKQVKTLTEEQIDEFTSLASSDERRNAIQLQVVVQLRSANRNEVALQTAKRMKEPSEAKTAMFIGEIKLLLDKKQFTEAIQLLEKSGEDAELRQHFKRSVLAMQYAETYDDSIAGQFAETYTNEEKMSVTELRETAKRAAENPDSGTRMDTLLEVFQEQMRFMDVAGSKQTLKLISEQLDKETDLVRIIEYRLVLARLLNMIRDKAGAKENLGKLMQELSGVKDLKELKDLVPEPPAPASQVPVAGTPEGRSGAIKLKLPGAGGESAVDESAIRNQLFQVYLMSAALLAQADAPVESKSAFERAKELARADSNAVSKAEKLLILAQFLTEQ